MSLLYIYVYIYFVFVIVYLCFLCTVVYSLWEKKKDETFGRSVFSSGAPVSSTNKTDRHYVAEILLKVALNAKTQNSIEIKKYTKEVNYWHEDERCEMLTNEGFTIR